MRVAERDVSRPTPPAEPTTSGAVRPGRHAAPQRPRVVRLRLLRGLAELAHGSGAGRAARARAGGAGAGATAEAERRHAAWAVSYSKVRAVTRVATPETEQALLDVALAGTAAHVERVVRAWRRTDRSDGRGGRGGGGGAKPGTAAGGFARPTGRVRAGGGLDRGTAGDRYQVVLHVDSETLAEDAAPDAQDHGAGGEEAHRDLPAERGRPAVSSGTVAEGEHAGGVDRLGAEGEDAHRDVPAGTRPSVGRGQVVRGRTPRGSRRRWPRTGASASGSGQPAASPARLPPSPCATARTAACSTSVAGSGPSPRAAPGAGRARRTVSIPRLRGLALRLPPHPPLG